VHFLIRLLGLTGLLAAGVGLVVASVTRGEGGPVVADLTWERLGEYAALGGGALVALAVLVEVLTGLPQLVGRRGAFGTNVVLQVLLAVVLLLGVNVYSFFHYRRYDWTRDHLFTIPTDIRDQLSWLQGDATIVVYQPYMTAGQAAAKPDHYNSAAERKVVEKVKDLTEEFQELFPPRFRFTLARPFADSPFDPGLRCEILNPKFTVVVLDEKDIDYEDKFEALTKAYPELRPAVMSAPESSVFFDAGGKVQRLAFSDIYLLDKQASQTEDKGQRNLVLLYQGVKPFANKILNIDERKPRVGIAVIHEWLTTEGLDDYGYGLSGLKKALTSRGFEVKDIVLKRFSQFGAPEPAVFTLDESKLDRLEERLAVVNMNLKTLKTAIEKTQEERDLWKKGTLDELNTKYAAQLRGRKITEAMRRVNQEEIQDTLENLQTALASQEKKLEVLGQEKGGLKTDSLDEQRHITDLKSKLGRALADCDLLIVPRMTLRNVSIGDAIPQRLHSLDDAQVEAIKEFLKADKPILACFGPINESPERRMPPEPGSGPDGLETLLGRLGIKFARQTVLFDTETDSFAELRAGQFFGAADVKVPPAQVEWKAGAGRPVGQAEVVEAQKSNPLRESLRVLAHNLGKDQGLDLHLRHPRPVYAEKPAGGKAPAFDPEFLMTNPASWNEDQPFPTAEKTPQFERPKPGDPSRGTLDEKRRGPFPIGVALEATLPADWYSEKDAKPATVRVAAIGHGGLFTGATLAPVNEKLLLDVTNWLLGRDDLLTKADPAREWRYPRVPLSDSATALWQWGTRLGMPMLFVYLGFVVLLVRRLR
jgi:hypothetical protein